MVPNKEKLSGQGNSDTVPQDRQIQTLRRCHHHLGHCNRRSRNLSCCRISARMERLSHHHGRVVLRFRYCFDDYLHGDLGRGTSGHHARAPTRSIQVARKVVSSRDSGRGGTNFPQSRIGKGICQGAASGMKSSW
jgi:hypothetical protein